MSNLLLAFISGATTIIVLEVIGLSNLLEPYRQVIQAVFGIFGAQG